jgi:hypothetical protein
LVDTLRLDTLDGLAFATDRNGIIRAVGANNWDVFSYENDTPELRSDTVIGRDLFSFIKGAQVQDQFKRIMQQVSQDPDWCWVLRNRCDAPDRKRIMRQSIRPVFSADACTGFVFQSVELMSQQRPRIDLFDFRAIQQKAQDNPDLPVVTMCSWCQRVRFAPVSGDAWIEAEDYYAAGGSSNVRLSHGLCPDCVDGAHATSP